MFAHALRRHVMVVSHIASPFAVVCPSAALAPPAHA